MLVPPLGPEYRPQTPFRAHPRSMLLHFFIPRHYSPTCPGPPQCRGFTMTLRHTTLGMIPLDE